MPRGAQQTRPTAYQGGAALARLAPALDETWLSSGHWLAGLLLLFLVPPNPPNPSSRHRFACPAGGNGGSLGPGGPGGYGGGGGPQQQQQSSGSKIFVGGIAHEASEGSPKPAVALPPSLLSSLCVAVIVLPFGLALPAVMSVVESRTMLYVVRCSISLGKLFMLSSSNLTLHENQISGR